MERRRAERAEEDVGAEPFERRAVGRRELQKGLEEPVQAPPRAQEAPGLLHVESLAEPLENGAARDERRHGGLGFRLHEQVVLVRVRPAEESGQKVQDVKRRAPPLPPSGDRGARSTKTRSLRPFDILLLSHKLERMARILITGITGQDGSYLAESHLASGDEVDGLVRQSSLLQRTRLDSVPALVKARSVGRLKLHYADLSDTSSLVSVLRNVKPDDPVPPGRAEPREDLLRPAGVHGRLDGPRDAAPPRVDAPRRARRPVLPRGHERDLRRGEGVAAERADADESDQPVRGGEGLRAEPREDLPERVRALRVRGDPLQPREPAPRRELRHAEDRARARRASRGGSRRSCTSGTLTPRARLELRPGHRGRHPQDRRRPEARRLRPRARGSRTRSGDFCEAAFRRRGARLPRSTSSSTPSTCVPSTSPRRAATRRRRGSELGWVPKTGFRRSSYASWWKPSSPTSTRTGTPPEAAGRPHARLPAGRRVAAGDRLAPRGRRGDASSTWTTRARPAGTRSRASSRRWTSSARRRPCGGRARSFWASRRPAAAATTPSSSSTRTSRARRTTSRGSAEAVTKNPGALVGSAVLYAREPARVWSAGGAVEWWGRGIRVLHHGAPAASLPKEPFPADWLFGMGTYVPVEVFDRIGLPDAARFPMAWGDLDFSLRAKRAGIPVVVAPAARLFHEVGDYDARVAGAPSARHVRGLDGRRPMHNLSLSAHAEIWRRHGPRILWPLSLAMRAVFLLLNFASRIPSFPASPLHLLRNPLRTFPDDAAVSRRSRS